MARPFGGSGRGWSNKLSWKEIFTSAVQPCFIICYISFHAGGGGCYISIIVLFLSSLSFDNLFAKVLIYLFLRIKIKDSQV